MAINATLVGNLTDDPTLRFGQNGGAWATFDVAVNEYGRDKSGERTETTSYIKCKMFGESAERFVATAAKGMRVILVGRFRQESWTDQQTQQKRSSVTFIVDEAGPSVRFATAEVTRVPGNGGAPRSNGAAAQAPASEIEFDSGENPFV